MPRGANPNLAWSGETTHANRDAFITNDVNSNSTHISRTEIQHSFVAALMPFQHDKSEVPVKISPPSKPSINQFCLDKLTRSSAVAKRLRRSQCRWKCLSHTKSFKFTPSSPENSSIHRIFPTILVTLSAFWANVTCYPNLFFFTLHYMCKFLSVIHWCLYLVSFPRYSTSHNSGP